MSTSNILSGHTRLSTAESKSLNFTPILLLVSASSTTISLVDPEDSQRLASHHALPLQYPYNRYNPAATPLPRPSRIRHTTGSLLSAGATLICQFTKSSFADVMCDWEEFQFVCGHNSSRLLSHCHFARTDPYHQCFGVKVIRHVWVQGVACQPCLDAMRAAVLKRAAREKR